MPNLAEPIVGAIVGTAVAQAITDSDLARKVAQIEEDLASIKSDMRDVASYYRSLSIPDKVESIRVPGSTENEIPLPARYGRRYMMLFVPPAGTAITFKIPGLGSVDLTLVGGWNELAFPNDTMIKMTASTSAITMIYRASNVPSGVTVVSV
jgi:hypothetical protein